MTRKYILVVLLGIIIFLGSVLLSISAETKLEASETCNLCHAMKPYVASYLKPGQGSEIAKHKLNCIGCHNNNSLAEARYTILKKIEISVFAKATGIELNTSLLALRVNCTGCHFIEDFQHLNATNNTGCNDCHWAHKPLTLIKLNGTLIPYGPHKNQSCQNCHGLTFAIPRCTNCHSGHGEQKLENNLCLGCHTDPHIPKKPGIRFNNTVKFTVNMPFSVCQPCHENEYFEVTYSISRHTEMQTCTKCHESHGEKPRCNKCHPVMQEGKHPSFGCANCHKTINGPIIVTCYDCHGRAVHDITGSAAVWNPK